jgi:hypothetical protein
LYKIKKKKKKNGSSHSQLQTNSYVQRQGRHQQDHITVEHHYHFDIFNVTIDFQLQELDNRFSEGAIELLTFS